MVGPVKIKDFLSDYLRVDHLKALLYYNNLKVSGNKSELVERLLNYEGFEFSDIFDGLHAEDLQYLCSRLDIEDSGKKADLRKRITKKMRSLGIHVVVSPAAILPKAGEKVYISEMSCPTDITISQNGFKISFTVQNDGKDIENIRIRLQTTWLKDLVETPLFDLKRGYYWRDVLLLTPPAKDGKYDVVVRLLDANEKMVGKTRELDVEFKTSGKEKLLHWGQEIANFILKTR